MIICFQFPLHACDQLSIAHLQHVCDQLRNTLLQNVHDKCAMLVSNMSVTSYAMRTQVLQMTCGPAKLPYSAATMFLLAFVPPVYFHVMHPCIERVIAHARIQ